MLVVSNTSPIANLAVTGWLDLLREQMGAVSIPPAVLDELSHHPLVPARRAIQQARDDGWLHVMPLAESLSDSLASTLHHGEAEALALAIQEHAGLILLDEAAARRKAREMGLAHTGVLGVLRLARITGRIPSLGAEIRRLRSEARVFVSAPREQALLASVGEI